MENEYISDDAYEDMAATFQVFMIHWLNDALDSNGIKDLTVRKKIISDFNFPFSVWMDQYWFLSEGKKVYPLVSFSSNGPAIETGSDGLGKVFLPSGAFSFKEYLGGNLYHYFDELKEDISKIESGLNE